MATVTLKKDLEIHTNGELPDVGAQAPDFKLTRGDLTTARLGDWANKKIVLNIGPSLDTPTCAESARKFNAAFSNRKDAEVLVVSADLPFAQGRFCSIEELENVTPLSMMKDRSFAEDYGVLFIDGPLQGLAARAIVIIDEAGAVMYTQLVPETGDEPDYDAALNALNA